MHTRIRTAIAAATAALALATLTAAAPAPAPGSDSDHHTRPASVSGTGRISYAFSPSDEIWFTVDAQAAPFTHPFPGVDKLEHGLPTDARGTVRWSHRDASTGTVYRAEAAVDCLVTGGPVATLTAVVTTSDIGNVGERIGLSIYDGHGRSRLGFSWGIGNLDVDAAGRPRPAVTGTCMAPAPFAPVVNGGFTVHHTELPTQ
ncbi:hypothetical protein F7Q99_03365 [Streptomyces kaniharaensis]|uniref:Repetin n=1 Tax=Streptomyces kaniharaensis TaxID=212423 RepID=A0A6N7KMI0_9ACTN|nr:hypothetical protein [Streptomyces kaniharaensis]